MAATQRRKGGEQRGTPRPRGSASDLTLRKEASGALWVAAEGGRGLKTGWQQPPKPRRRQRKTKQSSPEPWGGFPRGEGPGVPARSDRASGYLGDQLRSGHSEEITQAVPLASHERELCVPAEGQGRLQPRERLLWLNLPQTSSSR